MNVGGSEEVRALEYGDIKMTNESSDSERTKEGVGGNEMAGVEGEGVFVTVLEVGGRNERCYDFEADIVSEVRKYKSELQIRDSWGYLVETYELSSRVLIRPVEVEEKACFAPLDHWMPMYADYLAVGLWFPIPELLVGLLDYSIGLTQLAPNAMRGGSRKEKGWYYFTPRVSNKENKNLFTAGPSSIKGWKEKFLFVDDTEWERRDAEVEFLSSWKAKKANQNKYSLNSDEEEKVGKLVREGGDIVNIMYLTSSDVIEAAELYEPSSLSERDEVIEFIPRPPPIELDPEPTETKVGGAENAMGAKRFINTTFPKVDKRQAKEEVLRYVGAKVVKHALEEFVESVKERTILRRQCEQLQKEKDELEKKNKEMQEMLDEVVPAVKQLEDEKDSLSTKLVF
ncbi:hypothetical protein SLEP1_g38401 [Rubroshorea leprosula]|nr:hypothetical protein SLEP1_g38401 [Rubroshorea leprosula]